MANKVVKEQFGAPEKHILIANNSYLVTIGARVTNKGAQTDETSGRKILKAGTPLAGDITKRDMAFVATVEAQDATCILMHDVDVTNIGDDDAENATIVLAGCVDLLKIDATTRELYTSEMIAALPRIIFVEGSAI